jgi:hypothetical protein
MNFIVNSVIKSTVNKTLFNPGVTSCDMVDLNGAPCCSDPKEAKKRGMNQCGTSKKEKKRK